MSEESSNPFLGKAISLVTKAGVRYEGKLYTVVSYILTAYRSFFKFDFILFALHHLMYRSRTMQSHQ